MSDEQLEDLRRLVQDWQDDEDVSDRDLATALRKLAAEFGQ